MALACSGSTAAQNLESAIMPGPVIRGHAEIETACEKCHVRFDRSAQAKLCLDCHKPVGADIAGGLGYHGRGKDRGQNCRGCHAEHKGRSAKVVQLDEKTFDHGQTDFVLRGKHRKATCTSCHRAGAKHREAPSDCVSCHRKDDAHKGGLGPKCAGCHGEDDWKDGRFDHARTRFALRRAHAASAVTCESCHAGHKYADTSRECVSCHRDDDMKHGHKGHFGNRCEKCHDEGEWRVSIFRHDRDTKYPLLDRHRTVKCEGCHRAPLFRDRTPTRCLSCHRNDDIHKTALGDKCEKCHSTRGWKATSFDHDADTRFALRDRHKLAKCEACHADKGLREKPDARCIACHARDDRERGHKGGYGEKCEACHGAKAFKPATFDHGRDTRFPLAGKHLKSPCAGCHRGPLYGNTTAADCYSCHRTEDVHFATYGLDCERCHVADDWRKVLRQPDGKLPAARPPASPLRRTVP